MSNLIYFIFYFSDLYFRKIDKYLINCYYPFKIKYLKFIHASAFLEN